jgi:hypothetical protein
VAGVCNVATGACSNPNAANGTSCSDGNACTVNDSCQNGACTSGPATGCTCSDGIKNQGETGIDCGGPCAACPTCSDHIKNQGETGVDCGGPCAACLVCDALPATDGVAHQICAAEPAPVSGIGSFQVACNNAFPGHYPKTAYISAPCGAQTPYLIDCQPVPNLGTGQLFPSCGEGTCPQGYHPVYYDGVQTATCGQASSTQLQLNWCERDCGNYSACYGYEDSTPSLICPTGWHVSELQSINICYPNLFALNPGAPNWGTCTVNSGSFFMCKTGFPPTTCPAGWVQQGAAQHASKCNSTTNDNFNDLNGMFCNPQ